MSKIPPVKYTVILLAVLFVPFIMKKALREPYPALILPSGASKAKVKGGAVSCCLLTAGRLWAALLKFDVVPFHH